MKPIEDERDLAIPASPFQRALRRVASAPLVHRLLNEKSPEDANNNNNNNNTGNNLGGPFSTSTQTSPKKMSHLISINILERLKSLADQELTLKIEPIRMQQQG